MANRGISVSIKSVASSGLLDLLTTGGLGVFSPSLVSGCSHPRRVIVVSPFSLWDFLGLRDWRVIGSALLWVWLPVAIAFVIIAFATAGRRTTVPVKN